MQESWADAEFDASIFGDIRPWKSLVAAAEMIVVNRGKSFSAAVGNGLRQSVGDTFGDEDILPEMLLQGHYTATLDRCGEFDEILVVHDTSSLNYSGRRSLDELGPVNDVKGSKGLYVHSALSMTQSGLPLGMISVDIWTREADHRKQTGNELRTVPIEEKESHRWIRSHNACLDRLSVLLDSGKSVTLIGDRENDIIEAIAEPRHTNMHLLIRANHARRVATENGLSTLPDVLAATPESGTYVLHVPAKPGRSKRDATLTVKYTKVVLVPPIGKRLKIARQTVWVVCASEINPPLGEDPISWTLITTRQVDSFEQALKTIEFYTRRWVIERLHYTLKTGCLNVEKLQFHELPALRNAIAFYYILAWNVLSLVYSSRETPDEPAEEHIQSDHLLVLRKAVQKPIVTVLQAVKAIAELAGYANYPKSPLPGIKMIWMGTSKLTDMVAGARLFVKLAEVQ